MDVFDTREYQRRHLKGGDSVARDKRHDFGLPLANVPHESIEVLFIIRDIVAVRCLDDCWSERADSS
jgi:hypothetical protein